MFRNGVFEFRAPLILNALYYEYGFAEYNVANGRSAPHMAQGIVCPEALKGFYASVHSSATGERDPLGYWAERNSRPGVEKNYRGSILLVHGLQDWNVDPHHDFPWVNKLERKGLYVKYVLGQWGHAWPDSSNYRNPIPRWDWASLLLRWWDYWLKGKTQVDLGPRVEVQDSSLQWRRDGSWPPRDARPMRLYMSPDGSLAPNPSKDTSPGLVAFDPTRPGVLSGFDLSRGSGTCPTCATFRTATLEKDLRFAGIPRVEVEVTPTGPSGHLTAWIYAVEGTGSTRLGWGQVDLRFVHGGEEAKVVTPGQKLEVVLELEPLDAVVPKGAQLALVLHQGSYADHVPSGATQPVLVERGGRKNALVLDVFDRGKRSFFTPPDAPAPPPR